MATVIERDVIIVGAGPAGAVCASYLARAGFDVLLIDRELFPRDKVCGDIVREGFVKHAEALEAVAMLDNMSSCIRKLRLMSGGGYEAEVPFECYTVPRYELDKLMVDTAVSWGAEFRQGCRFVDVIYDGGKVSGVVVREKGGKRIIRGRIVIGADGVSSDFLRSIEAACNDNSGAGYFNNAENRMYDGGLPGGDEISDGIWIGLRAYFKGLRLDKSLSKEQYEAGGIFAFDDKQGPAYFWIMPVGADGVKRGICNVGMLARGRDRYKAGELTDRINAWIAGNEKISSLISEAEMISPWAYGRIADVTQNRKAAGNGYMLIGDAAAKVMPLVCDGLSAAADSAKAAAIAVDAAFREGDFSGEVLQAAYEDAMKMQRGNSAVGVQTKRGSGTDAQTGKTSVSGESRYNIEDRMKLDRLLMESMNDPHVMDKIVSRLAKDVGYRKNVGI